jgi:hypothetical protein
MYGVCLRIMHLAQYHDAALVRDHWAKIADGCM